MNVTDSGNTEFYHIDEETEFNVGRARPANTKSTSLNQYVFRASTSVHFGRILELNECNFFTWTNSQG